MKSSNLGHALSWSEGAERLRRGLPLLFPTDTVWGLGVSVNDAPDPQVLYQLKGRSYGKPIAWLVSSPDQASLYAAELSPQAKALMENFWPGALTLIVKSSNKVPRPYVGAEGTIGLRMPDLDPLRELMDEIQSPLATTSANVSGQPAAATVSDLSSHLIQSVGSYIDPSLERVKFTGDKPQRLATASTVIDLTRATPRVLRQGDLYPILVAQGFVDATS